jgi:hypothetical protein
MFRYIVLAAIVGLVIYTGGTIGFSDIIPFIPALVPKPIEQKKEKE